MFKFLKNIKKTIKKEYTLTLYEDGVPNTINLEECNPYIILGSSRDGRRRAIERLIDRLMQEYENDSSMKVFYLACDSKCALRMRSIAYASSLYVEVFDCSSESDVNDFIRLHVAEELSSDANSQMEVFIVEDLQCIHGKSSNEQFYEIIKFFSGEADRKSTCRIIAGNPGFLSEKGYTGLNTLLLCEV